MKIFSLVYSKVIAIFLFYLIMIITLISLINCDDYGLAKNMWDPNASSEYKYVTAIEPANNSEILITTPTIRWKGIEQASAYELEIAITPFVTCVNSNGILTDCVANTYDKIISTSYILTETEYTPTTAMDYNQYYWRVRPISFVDESGNPVIYKDANNKPAACIETQCIDKQGNATSCNAGVCAEKEEKPFVNLVNNVAQACPAISQSKDPCNPITSTGTKVEGIYGYWITQSDSDSQAEGWTFTIAHESITAARQFAGIAITDSQIFVVAGVDESAGSTHGVATNDAFMYSIIDNKWSVMKGLSIPTGKSDARRSGLGAATYNGYLYAFGGKTALNETLSNFQRVPISSAKDGPWDTSLPSMISARSGFSTVIYNNELYVFGGDNNMTAMKEAEKIDLTNPSAVWVSIPSMPARLIGTSAVVFNDKIWVIGGKDKVNLSFADIYIYDPASSTWSTGPTLTSQRSYTYASVFNGKVYVIGGKNVDNTKITGIVDICDTASCIVGSIPLPEGKERSGGNGFNINGKIWLVGGETKDLAIFDKDAQNPITGTLGRWMP